MNIIDTLKEIREELPYDNHDPVRNRDLAIQQISAMCKHFRSLGVKPNTLSPTTEILHALKNLNTGRSSTLLKPARIKFSPNDKMLYTMAAAAFGFLQDTLGTQNKASAEKVLKIAQKYNFPKFRTRKDAKRSLTDQISETTQLVEWAKACSNGRKGLPAKEHYKEIKKSLEENWQTIKDNSDKIDNPDNVDTPEKVIDRYFQLTIFEDIDPYRVK